MSSKKASVKYSRDDRLEKAIWRLNVTAHGEEEMDLGHAGFSDDDLCEILRYLGRNKFCRDIQLMGNQCSDEGARAMARALRANSTLTKLDLRENLIDDEGAGVLAEALRENRTLEILDLPNNSIGDAGAAAFARALASPQGCAGLTTLRLGSNPFGPNGALKVIKALATNAALTHLDLSRASLGPDHGRALGESLKLNGGALSTLMLEFNNLGDAGVVPIAEALAHRAQHG
eukprot:CAMPEP_0172602840 /NCGR_PEP_ID=MMETSP1068-20121228/23020_1 /TAXON_ID=35684 /ORGANISM="Pseudopedinella elastica, Strain CCMP716" /LENGTH=231 /DNA_ID=CAMNT_0013404345 /DNA_START=77 /DNA_END=769 /DNA_ORIENTATION=-